MFAFSTLAVAASLLATVAADHGHGLHVRSPHHVGRSNLQKRFSGTATYYAVGLGACGKTNVPSDFIVALNSAQYGGGYPGPNCFKPITICANGKCVGATIVDECPTCGYGSLDLSEGLFTQFASTDAGVFQMTWTFAGDEPAPAPTTTKKPDPTTTWKPEPTTTWKPEPTTTWKPEPTTTWEAPTTTSTKRRTTTYAPPPEPTTTTHEPTTSSTSHTPTTTSSSTSTSTIESTSTTSVASISIEVAAAKSATSTSSSSAAPSASASSSSTTGSGNSNSSGTGSGSGSGSNLADAQQVMVALGRMVTAANTQ